MTILFRKKYSINQNLIHLYFSESSFHKHNRYKEKGSFEGTLCSVGDSCHDTGTICGVGNNCSVGGGC